MNGMELVDGDVRKGGNSGSPRGKGKGSATRTRLWREKEPLPLQNPTATLSQHQGEFLTLRDKKTDQ